MNFVSLYRSLLKGIHAAEQHPYHLQDIRFILSYPLVQPKYYTVNLVSGANPSEPLKGVDASLLVRTCVEDLRRAFLNVSPKGISVTEQFMRLRELGWLKSRLQGINSSETQTMLCETRCVAGELTEEDFLDDDVFTSRKQPIIRGSEKTPTGSSGGEDEDYSCGVASAGAVGPVYEMFTLQNVTTLPLVREFLSTSSLNSEAVSIAVTCNQKLQAFAQHHIPRSVMCKNEDLTLTVEVRPFDSAFAGQSTGDDGPFAYAHRHFMVRFGLLPHDPSVLDVDVINSYFLRFDVGSSELVEDVGFLHAADVLKLANRLSAGGSKYSMHGDGSNGDADIVDTVSKPYKSHNDEIVGECAASDEQRHDSASGFELCFINSTDNPTIMKGQLYYALRKETNPSASELHVRAISFEHVLLFNDR